MVPVVLAALLLGAGCLSTPKGSPSPGGVQLGDGGTPGLDAGTPGVDAGTPGLDAGPPGVEAGPPGWTIQPISASFDQLAFGTHYKASLDASSTSAMGASVTFSWTIQLTLVDPAGAPDPTTPGSAAAADSACDNAGDGTSAPSVQTMTPAAHLDGTFTWFHPDAANSTPPGKYACDHAKQGPSGHQGLITVVVSDGKWQCTAEYKGTHSSDASSVTNGIASAPVCLKF